MKAWRLRCLLALLMTTAGASAAPPSLQALVDAAPAGGSLLLAPGRYAGPVRIDKPLTIEGDGRAEIRGPGRGTVVTVSGRNVTLRGLRIAGSGNSHDSMDAGIQVEGFSHTIADNTLDDVFFGIHLKGANDTRVRNNRITGKDLSLGLRGDALRVWNGHGNRIEDNRFRRARDITFANSSDCRVRGNHFSDGRYGMHLVFSPRLLIENNVISRTSTGIVVLYSPDQILRGNRIEHALDGGGGAIVFKESDAALVEDNAVLHCAVGLKVDAPPEPVGVLTVRNNRFAHNLIGLFFYGEAGGHRFTDNRFENNLTTVAVSAPGAGAANRWQANHWDEYQGFDRDGDGRGDTPHEQWLFADRIWMETPMASFFRASPGLELIDFLERLAPFSSPHRLLQDVSPRMR